MPTDRSSPDWRCDICGASYRTDLAAAQRCEAQPVPEPLPPGTLLLHATSAGTRFALSAVESASGPRAAEGGRNGHTWSYRLVGQHDPRSGTMIWPHRAGKLNILGSLYRGPFAGYYHAPIPAAVSRTVAATAERIGLRLDAANLERWVDQRGPDEMICGPLTAPIREVLESLGVTPAPFTPPRPNNARWAGRWWTAAGALARQHNANREWAAQVWLLTTPEADIDRALNDRLRRWWAGENVTCPAPTWRPTPCATTQRPLTPSKLSKAQRAAVAASGVEWRDRTNSTTYAHACAKHLEVHMDHDHRLFAVPAVVVVCGGKGGVGKSTVAAAVAAHLAAGGTRTVLLDLDLTGPSQHLIWALDNLAADTTRRRIEPTAPAGATPAGLGVISLGQLLKPGEELAWDGATRRSWVEFLGGAVNLDGVEIIVVDLPPGRTVLYDLLADDHPTQAEAWIHVTTAHPVSIDATARLLPAKTATPSTRPPIVVENLSEAAVDLDGTRRTVRLVGHDGDAEALAAAHDALYGGSLPFADSAQALAETAELRHLVDLVRQQSVPTEYSPSQVGQGTGR